MTIQEVCQSRRQTVVFREQNWV